MTYQKIISKTYQDEIDAFIAKNGVKQLSNTDNKLGEMPSYRTNRKSSLDRLEARKGEYQWHTIKDALMTGEIISSKEIGDNAAFYVYKMRKAGWEIQTIKNTGYKLIKAGGYVFW